MRIRSLLAAALICAAGCNTVCAQDIPDFLYDGVSRIKISGSVSPQLAGEFVSVVMKADDGDYGYVGQAIVKKDGTYKHEFDFANSPEAYKLTMNVGGKLIDANSVRAIAIPERVNVDLKAAQHLSMVNVTAQIEDYYGMFTGGTDYVLVLAFYDERGALIGITRSDDEKSNRAGKKTAKMIDAIPEGAVSCKAFVLNSFVDLLPLSAAKPIEITAGTGYDDDNSSGAEWQSVNMRTEAMKTKGLRGGEGGQRIMSIAISSDDSLILCGNDTGGINRSADGGMTWEDCLRGFLPGGSTAIAIDPKNKNRVIAAGNTQKSSVSSIQNGAAARDNITGLYLSEDAGVSWRQVLSQPGAVTYYDFREAICYDPSSYNAELGYCTTAYWSRPWNLQGSQGEIKADSQVYKSDADRKGLWKTTDGGATWSLINGEMSDGVVKVHPKTGVVYVANLNGFHRSVDGGQTFTTVLNDGIYLGLDVINKSGYENYVWVNNPNGVFRSTDSGASFTEISSMRFPQSESTTNVDQMVRGLKVNPNDPTKMLIGSYNGSSYQSKKYYGSQLFGSTYWREASHNTDNDFFGRNNREPVFVWSNTSSNKAWSVGGDWITSSSDSGKTWKWDYSGGGDVHVDQRTIFNIYDPNIMYFGSQDYHGALTTDGGDTWKHIWNIPPRNDKLSGFVYGSYAADEQTLIAISAQSWTSPRYLYISRDAGNTWTETGCKISDNAVAKIAESCYQSPSDPNVLFAAQWRSDDFGATWSQMEGVYAVNSHNPTGRKELYGAYRDKIRVSYDDGLTWEDFCTVETSGISGTVQIYDIDYSPAENALYYISGNSGTGVHFCKVKDGVTTELTDNIKGDERLGKTFQVCAVDPNSPGIVYVGGYGGDFLNPYAVQRSTDGGNTFFALTTNNNDTIVRTGPAGGIDAYDLIVNPKTGELWVAQGCNGWAKIAPPY